jgi:AbrB family looped-hinge helix DNA binding protein
MGELPRTDASVGNLLVDHMVNGTLNAMTLKIDKVGRIVLPKPLRERLGLKPDSELEALEHAGGVLLRAVAQRPSMIKIDGLWVHQGVARPGTDWDGVVHDVREERTASVLKP